MAQTHTVRSLDEIRCLIANHGDEEGIVVRLGRTIPKLSEAQAMGKRLREKKDQNRWVVDLKPLEPLEQISADLFDACRSLSYIIDITKPSDHAPTNASTIKLELDPGQRARLVAEQLRLVKRRAMSADEQFGLANRSSLHPAKRLGVNQASHHDNVSSKESSLLSSKRLGTDQASSRDDVSFLSTKRLGTDQASPPDDVSLLSTKRPGTDQAYRRDDVSLLPTKRLGTDQASRRDDVSSKESSLLSPKLLGTDQDARRANRSAVSPGKGSADLQLSPPPRSHIDRFEFSPGKLFGNNTNETRCRSARFADMRSVDISAARRRWDDMDSPQAARHGSRFADAIRSVSAERRRPDIGSSQAARHGTRFADAIRSVSAERHRSDMDSPQAAHSGARFALSSPHEKLSVDNDANRSLSADRARFASQRSYSAERHRLDRPKGRFINPQLADSIHKAGAKLLKAPILSVANLGDRLKQLGLDLLRDEGDVVQLRAELIACKKELVAVWNSKVSLI